MAQALPRHLLCETHVLCDGQVQTVGEKLAQLVGELSQSIRMAGMHMGLYHSIFEFYHPLYLEDKANNFTTSRYVDEVFIPQSKELNQLYKPDLIWSDGDWEAHSSCKAFASAAMPSSIRVAELIQVLTRHIIFICPQNGLFARRLEINRAPRMDVQRRSKP